MSISYHQIKTLAKGRYIRHIKNDTVYRFDGIVKCREHGTTVWYEYYQYSDVDGYRFSRVADDFGGFDLIEPSDITSMR